MITKAVITYADGQEKTYEGENLILGNIPHSIPEAASVPPVMNVSKETFVEKVKKIAKKK